MYNTTEIRSLNLQTKINQQHLSLQNTQFCQLWSQNELQKLHVLGHRGGSGGKASYSWFRLKLCQVRAIEPYGALLRFFFSLSPSPQLLLTLFRSLSKKKTKQNYTSPLVGTYLWHFRYPSFHHCASSVIRLPGLSWCNVLPHNHSHCYQDEAYLW